MKTIEELAYLYGWADEDIYYEGYEDGKTEMEQNPSDALIMRILNCIGYEEKSWIEFVRKELEKRKEE